MPYIDLGSMYYAAYSIYIRPATQQQTSTVYTVMGVARAFKQFKNCIRHRQHVSMGVMPVPGMKRP